MILLCAISGWEDLPCLTGLRLCKRDPPMVASSSRSMELEWKKRAVLVQVLPVWELLPCSAGLTWKTLDDGQTRRLTRHQCESPTSIPLSQRSVLPGEIGQEGLTIWSLPIVWNASSRRHPALNTWEISDHPHTLAFHISALPSLHRPIY